MVDQCGEKQIRELNNISLRDLIMHDYVTVLGLDFILQNNS